MGRSDRSSTATGNARGNRIVNPILEVYSESARHGWLRGASNRKLALVLHFCSVPAVKRRGLAKALRRKEKLGESLGEIIMISLSGTLRHCEVKLLFANCCRAISTFKDRPVNQAEWAADASRH